MKLRLLIIAVLLIGAAPAEAQPARDYQAPLMDRSYYFTALPYYNFMARQIVSRRVVGFSFSTFRMYYAMTPHYDPLAEKARKQLLDLAFDMRYNLDPERRKEAGVEYAAFLVSHLANIDVVTQALSLSQENRRFGDPEFLNWVRRELVKSVVTGGDGVTLERAYEIITLGEETALLRHLNLNVLTSENVESGGMYYGIREVSDPESHDKYALFVNLTKPMKYLEYERRENSLLFDFGRQ